MNIHGHPQISTNRWLANMARYLNIDVTRSGLDDLSQDTESPRIGFAPKDVPSKAPKIGIHHAYDLVVIGSGVTGLSAATKAAHSGLNALVVDYDYAPGGLFATLSNGELFPGRSGDPTPFGITQNMLFEAQRLGVEFMVPAKVQEVSDYTSEWKLVGTSYFDVIAKVVIDARDPVYKSSIKGAIEGYDSRISFPLGAHSRVIIKGNTVTTRSTIHGLQSEHPDLGIYLHENFPGEADLFGVPRHFGTIPENELVIDLTLVNPTPGFFSGVVFCPWSPDAGECIGNGSGLVCRLMSGSAFK